MTNMVKTSSFAESAFSVGDPTSRTANSDPNEAERLVAAYRELNVKHPINSPPFSLKVWGFFR